VIKMNATYSPEDNKLRLYVEERLDSETYSKIKAAGFRWAPRQNLFVAPMWTPKREDLLINLCGEIEDEDTSLVDRAEEKVSRLEGYSKNRLRDAETAKNMVSAIVDNIPLGQPILVGHHSEGRARRDIKRIEDGMHKAVKMWETADYWKKRAEGALQHAKYKERPDVRARRIKKLEAEIRQCQAYFTPDPKQKPIMMASRDSNEQCLHVWCAPRGGRGGSWVKESSLPALKAHYTRWINHYENRLVYEKAMLDDQGRSDLIAPKPRPKQLPLLNYQAPSGITVINPSYSAQKETHMDQVEMTKEEYNKISNSFRGSRIVDGTHRIRVCSGVYARIKTEGLSDIERLNKKHQYYAVFLTDSKVHVKGY